MIKYIIKLDIKLLILDIKNILKKWMEFIYWNIKNLLSNKIIIIMVIIIIVVWKNKRYKNRINKNNNSNNIRYKCNRNNKIISKVKIIEIYDNDIIKILFEYDLFYFIISK